MLGLFNKRPNKVKLTPLRSAERANLHEALFFLAYDNARNQAAADDQQSAWQKA